VILNLQVMRAVAALMVVCFHILYFWQHSHANTYPTWLNASVGAAGVDLFFVISGFIMLETTLQGHTSPLSFLRKRLIRIAPFYWLLVILLAARHYYRDAGQFDWQWLVQSLLFLPHIEGNMAGAVFPASYFPILVVGWTLTFEMFFYAIFAGALILRQSAYWPLIVPAVFVVVTILAHSANNAYADYYGHPVIFEFLYGMAIAAFRPPLSRPWLANPLSCAVLIAAGCIGMIAANSGMLETTASVRLVDGLAAAAIVYGAVHLERRGYVVTNRLFLSIGAASYSLYLTHTVFLLAVEKLLAAYPPEHFLTMLVIYVCILLCSIVLALGSYAFFERPTQRLLTRLFDFGRSHDAKMPQSTQRPNRSLAKAAD
jgi:exopolysaccharide production protein ExoZ